MPLLDQLLLPQRLTVGLLERLEHAFDTFDSLRDEIARIRMIAEPVPDELDALRVEFGGSNVEIARLREAFVPELSAVRAAADGISDEVSRMRELMVTLDSDIREMGQRLTEQMASLNQTLSQLARDANEITDVVEPLQSATERVGRVAERLPGRSRKP